MHSLRYSLTVCICWLVFCAVAFSNAGYSVLVLLTAIVVAGTWMLIWLIRLVVFLVRRRRGKTGGLGLKNAMIYWGVEPLALIMGVSLAALGAFSIVRFTVSVPALNAYVDEVRGGRVNLAYDFNHPTRYIGLFAITRTDLLSDGTVRLITSADGLMSRAGLAKSPSFHPPRQGEDSYRNLVGQWWYWRESW